MSENATVGYVLTWLLPGTILSILTFMKRRKLNLTKLEAVVWSVPLLAMGPLLLIAAAIIRGDK